MRLSQSVLFLILLMAFGTGFSQNLDFSHLQIVALNSGERSQYYAQLLQEELEKRIAHPVSLNKETDSLNRPVILLARYTEKKHLPEKWQGRVKDLVPLPAESYRLFFHTEDPYPSLLILGQDDRGLLYGIGEVLRKMVWSPGRLNVPVSLEGASSPTYPIRGHQLGYRPKTNAYDAFDKERFDQYIRELALFGANSIEIVPPRTDDDFTSRHMPLPPLEMIQAQSNIADKMDLDVWMWYPNMGKDYQNEDSLAYELSERREVFAAVPRLDHLFVPGGDPGDLDPDVLFDWLAKISKLLRQYHPQAKIWVSPQVFRPTQAWFDAFFYHINQRYDWLGGVVFGPWVKIPLPELRELVDPSLPIRRYPDITHSLSSQYPVPDWDLPLAMTLGRECINPRPIDQKQIHNALARYADGSISYSEGTNDDVNKFIWTAQDWDPARSAIETLRDYARFFMGPEWTESVAQGLLAEENNLKGPLLTNGQVGLTLLQWQEMEQKADPRLQSNFRFQMGLIRAYFDAYIQQKLIHQTWQEQQARNSLLRAEEEGTLTSISEAIRILENPWREKGAKQLREKCTELAEALYQSIGAQLTVEPHGAAPGRGNFIDNLDATLNDAPWLLDNLRAIATIKEDSVRAGKLKELINRTNPGPGGFYDNFGTTKSWNRIIKNKPWNKDPGSLYGPRVSFGVGLIGEEWVHEVEAIGFEGISTPLSWMMQVNTLFDTPLRVRYDDLNPEIRYQLKIAYTGRFRSRMKLSTSDGIEIHDFIQTGTQPIHTFWLPRSAYSSGSLTLSWTCGEGERGAQVAELWIIPEIKNP